MGAAAPLAACHRRVLWSMLPDTRYCESGDHARSYTSALCPLRAAGGRRGVRGDEAGGVATGSSHVRRVICRSLSSFTWPQWLTRDVSGRQSKITWSVARKRDRVGSRAACAVRPSRCAATGVAPLRDARKRPHPGTHTVACGRQGSACGTGRA